MVIWAAQAPPPRIRSSPAPTRSLCSAGGRRFVLRGEGGDWPIYSPYLMATWAAQAPPPHIRSSPAPTRSLCSAGGRCVVLRGVGGDWPTYSQRSCQGALGALLRQSVPLC